MALAAFIDCATPLNAMAKAANARCLFTSATGSSYVKTFMGLLSTYTSISSVEKLNGFSVPFNTLTTKVGRLGRLIGVSSWTDGNQ